MLAARSVPFSGLPTSFVGVLPLARCFGFPAQAGVFLCLVFFVAAWCGALWLLSFVALKYPTIVSVLSNRRATILLGASSIKTNRYCDFLIIFLSKRLGKNRYIFLW